MLKNRLIAVLIIRDGQVVQSIQFKHTNIIHWNPVEAIDVFNEWAIDEIVVLNVSRKRESKSAFIDIVGQMARKCYVPLAAGGWIEDLQDAAILVNIGADKVVMNTAVFRDPALINRVADKFGSQCCVVSMDVKRDNTGVRKVCIDRGREMTKIPPLKWAKSAVTHGAGEILFNSIDHDGNRTGFDIEQIRELAEALPVPVIAFGGVQTWDHLVEGIIEARADAVAAANILHYTEHSVVKAKKFLIEQGLNFRKI